MPAKPKTPATDPFSTTEKLMQTFRMPRELVTFLRGEADASGRDLTAFVNRHLDGLRTWFGLPGAATPGRTRGITGLVYRSVRGVTRAVGEGLEMALGLLGPALQQLGGTPRQAEREAKAHRRWVSAAASHGRLPCVAGRDLQSRPSRLWSRPRCDARRGGFRRLLHR